VVAAIHAADAWVVQPVGGADVGLRLARLALLAASAGLLALAWRRPRARPAIALCVGIAASVVGGAIVVPRAAQGLGGNGLTGLLALAAGLFLAGIGIAGLVGRRRWWRPVIAGVVGLLVAQFVLFPAVLAVYATNAPRPELGPRAPADVGLVADDVTVRSSDGTRLAAWYVASRNGAAVLLLHGSGSTRDDMLDHAAMLARHGHGVLLLDVRGHGGSEGEPMELGWGGERDVRAAVGYLSSRPDVDPGRIGVLGQSMGGEQAITAAATDSRIAAVVTEGAEVVTTDDASADPATVGGWPSVPMLWVSRIVSDLLSDASPPPPHSESIAAIAPRPVLLISGQDPAEAASNRFFRDAGGPTVELWHLDDAPHTAGLRVHPAEYERRVVAFLDAALG
jgi:pimeloyl-ACP methyl ester carboxylesterase